MSNNVKVVNKSPLQFDIAGKYFGCGETQVKSNNPEFFANYVNNLGFAGLVAEVITSPASLPEGEAKKAPVAAKTKGE